MNLINRDKPVNPVRRYGGTALPLHNVTAGRVVTYYPSQVSRDLYLTREGCWRIRCKYLLRMKPWILESFSDATYVKMEVQRNKSE